MSNQATHGKNVPQRFSTLSLIEGRDCDPYSQNPRPDLYVRGGAFVKKTMCVRGNVHASTLFGNLEGTIVGDSEVLGSLDVYGNIHAGAMIAECDTTLMKNLDIKGNVTIDRHLKSKYASLGFLKVNTIDAKIIKSSNIDLNSKHIKASRIETCDVTSKNIQTDNLHAGHGISTAKLDSCRIET
jgi:hypothetical protein